MISPSEEPIRNLGAWFDRTFNLNHHINKTCRSAFYHLHNIRRIRRYLKYLSRESTEKLVHAFVTSHLDYCNGLLYGLPNNGQLLLLVSCPCTVCYMFCTVCVFLYRAHSNWFTLLWCPCHFCPCLLSRCLFAVLLRVFGNV